MPTRLLTRLVLVAAVGHAGCGDRDGLPAGEAAPDEEHQGALTRSTDPPDAVIDCIGDTQGQLAVTSASGASLGSPPAVKLGDTALLTWRATIPVGCSIVKVTLDGAAVPAAGSRVVQPMANTLFVLRATAAGGTRDIAALSVLVTLPNTVNIVYSSQKPLLLQALRTANTTINVGSNVDMDLSDITGITLEYIAVAPGVVLRGTRTPRDPGPRLYTTRRPKVFLEIRGDSVRITGMRIQGVDAAGLVYNGDEQPRGILSDAHQNIEIDNNEIYGWAGSGVRIENDYLSTGYLHPQAIRVHDNFIHENQHEAGDGYGVEVTHGGYATIQHNVFDGNRHAISGGDGSNWSGYVAEENLVLPHGGLHRYIPLFGWVHTHQFDMHAQGNCGIADIWSDSLWNCGTAGEDAYIRRNTFLYSVKTAVKLRGTPQMGPYGFFVESNVFAEPSPDSAVQQNESGLYLGADNVFGYDGSSRLGSCDFDGDGVDDTFMATGQTWWFSSGGAGPWTFLRASKSRLDELTFGDFDGDRRCDVKVGDTIVSGGRG